MSDFDLAPLHSILAQLTPQGQAGLLPALHEAQSIFGWLPEPVIAEISQALHVPLADINGVIDFYDMFYRRPVGKTILRICTDPSCAMAGGDQVLDTICEHLGVSPDEVSADGQFMVERSPCLGLCDNAPAMLVAEKPLGRVSPDRIAELCKGEGYHPKAIIGGEPRILTGNCGQGRPTSLKDYVSKGGYNGLKKAFALNPDKVIAEVKASGLVGRGGAAFPAGLKWEGAAQAQGYPKYIVCNADESEPGTFKDRVLLEEDPHRILEGMLIAAYAIGASKGYIYVRGEYPQAYKIMSEAIQEAIQAGYLGQNILGACFDFEIELRLGAGAYICGEETALFESIEGKRGFPRIKPPFPTTHGLFSQPTVINNVETLCNIPTIIERGAIAYRQIGTEKSPGTKLFCLSGDVMQPGLYEIPFGTRIRTLLYELGGGLCPGKDLQAILFGGAAGAFATKNDLDVEMSFEGLRAAGLPLGSGVVLVIDNSRDMRDILQRLGKFFAHESCGKCYPCQIGTQRQYEILQRIAAGNPLPGDVERLSDIGWTMTDASICGLGQTAATAVLSALKHWPDLFSAKVVREK